MKTENRVVLYGETSNAITNMLATRVRESDESNKEESKRIYLNWIKFIGSLKSDGSLFGMEAN